MIAIALKLLGWGKLIGQFILKHWKIFAVAIALYLAYDRGYDKGVSNERAVWEQKIEKEDRENREFEKRMGDRIEQYNQKLLSESLKRKERETVHHEKLKTIIENNTIYQDCKVEQGVIDERNAIRAEGPKNEN